MADPTPPQLGAFLGAIRTEESGGNYVEPNGQGAYQIIQSNWPSWALRYAGYKTTDPNASDAPPAVQDEVARGAITADYYGRGDKSWRKVAMIWNGGQPYPVPNETAFGPGGTTADYADRVLALMGQAAPGAGSPGVVGGPAVGGSSVTGAALTGDDWITALDGALNPDIGGASLNPLKDASDIGKTVAMIGTRVSFAIIGVTLLGAGLLLAFGRDIFGGHGGAVGDAAATIADNVPVADDPDVGNFPKDHEREAA